MTAETKPKKATPKKRVPLDKKLLTSVNKSKFDLRTMDVPCPELNELMGLGEDEITIIVVRQMEFEELIDIQHDQFNMMRNLVEGVVQASITKEGVEKALKDASKGKSAAFIQRIDTLEKCIVEPKLTRSEIIYIARMWPSVVMKLYQTVINLTDRGADLKKNSID
jgi:hypothetical protein